MIDYSNLAKHTNDEFTELIRSRIELQKTCRDILYSTVRYDEHDVTVVYAVGIKSRVHFMWKCEFNRVTKKFKCSTL